MSSACSVPRLVRCRVRDLASCFYACRLPLDEEPEISHSKRPQTTRGRQKKSNYVDQISVNVGKKESNEEEEADVIRGESTVQCSSQNNMLIKAEEDGSMAEPRFAEEDYIVFCFRDDGEIHMVNEAAAKSSSSQAYDVNDYDDGDNGDDNGDGDDYDDDDGDDDADVDHHGHASKPNTLRNIMTRQGEWPPDDEDEEERKEKKKITSVDEEQPNGSKMESFESCDSNLSDTSTTSFAFPVLGIEWIGSPVHMPKSEKHDAQSVRLHCCRF